jgi:hypothetical protein
MLSYEKTCVEDDHEMKLEPIEHLPTEPRLRNVKFVLIGALYGLLIGAAFLTSATIADKLLYPDLPLGTDWSLFITRGTWIVLGLILIGAITSLFSETLPGLLVGAGITAVVALVSALVSSSVMLGLKIMVLIFALLPMAALSLPVTLILRWLVDKHADAIELQHVRRIASLLVLAIVLGVGTGYFAKMSRRAVEATRFMNHLLQTAPQDPKSPIHEVQGFENHMGMSYQLFQRSSESSTEGFDVRAEYADGYSITCVVVSYPGSEPYLSDCTSTQE